MPLSVAPLSSAPLSSDPGEGPLSPPAAPEFSFPGAELPAWRRRRPLYAPMQLHLDPAFADEVVTIDKWQGDMATGLLARMDVIGVVSY